MIKHWDDGKN